MKRIKLAFKVVVELDCLGSLSVDDSIKILRTLRGELWEAIHRATERLERELEVSTVYAAVQKEEEEYEEVGESTRGHGGDGYQVSRSP